PGTELVRGELSLNQIVRPEYSVSSRCQYHRFGPVLAEHFLKGFSTIGFETGKLHDRNNLNVSFHAFEKRLAMAAPFCFLLRSFLSEGCDPVMMADRSTSYGGKRFINQRFL